MVQVNPIRQCCQLHVVVGDTDVNKQLPLILITFFRSAPAGQVAQLIGHKGQNGLYALLRSKGWAHHLVATHKTFGKGFSLFLISVHLTESGEKFIDDVITHVFQFINLLKSSGPLQWFYEELKYLTEQQFEQQDVERPQNYASNLAVSLIFFQEFK